jgi:hypothetical protein
MFENVNNDAFDLKSPLDFSQKRFLIQDISRSNKMQLNWPAESN